jgi:hypothetical protein
MIVPIIRILSKTFSNDQSPEALVKIDMDIKKDLTGFSWKGFMKAGIMMISIYAILFVIGLIFCVFYNLK